MKELMKDTAVLALVIACGLIGACAALSLIPIFRYLIGA